MIERVDDYEGFAALRGEWNALLARSDAATPFLTWEWLSAWWRTLGAGLRLQILAVRSEGRLVGIAPLFVPRWEPRRLRLYPHVSFLGSPLTQGNVGSDYLDFIVDPTVPEAVDELAAALGTTGRVLDLGQVAAERSAAERVSRRLVGSGWRLQQEPRDVCPWIDLEGHDWESYLAARGSEHRYAVQRKLRKIRRDFEMSFARVTEEGDRREALQQLMDLHERRWRERGESDAFHTPALRSFHEEFTAHALANGWLRLYVLRLDGAPAAAFYGLRYGDTVSFFQSGFDPAFARHSVGVVTMALSIKEAIAEGARRYDMLHGSEEYKFHWANATRPLARYVLYPRHALGTFARGLAGLHAMLRPMARRVLQGP
jgi:CelD/BcsL family acetyltransferase involved in cellulose biosynthesis